LAIIFSDCFGAEFCDSARVMTALAPHVRSRFAKRLKALRQQRGFDRARFFAKTLGIEENRYTRYERAEVEPSLTLIQKMCDTLRVTPNELLGFADPPEDGSLFWVPPCAAADEAPTRGDGAPPDPVSALAWRLASAAVAIRQEQAGKQPAGDPLETIRETGKLFADLKAKPFGAVAEIVRDPSLKAAASEKTAMLAELIRAYTETVSGPITPL
jgi:transcriptional regulator with XRE-family HTH domain